MHLIKLIDVLLSAAIIILKGITHWRDGYYMHIKVQEDGTTFESWERTQMHTIFRRPPVDLILPQNIVLQNTENI
mgnify:CR=1 FL=1